MKTNKQWRERVRKSRQGTAVAAVPVALLALATVWPDVAVAQQAIGSATDVDRAGFRAADGATVRQEIEADDPVFLLDRISTDPSGRLRLALDDNSVLVVGPDSRLSLDSFVYSPDGGSLAVDLSVGGFRFLSGDMPSDSYQLRTPTATVGLRGSDVVVLYGRLRTQVIVLAGEGWILPDGTTIRVFIPAGQSATAGAGGPATLQPAPRLPTWAGITLDNVGSGQDGAGGPDTGNDSPITPSGPTEDPPDPGESESEGE